MAFVSVTRLRVRSIRFLPAFFAETIRTQRQVRRSPGFEGGALLADRRWTFWTATVWSNQDVMRSYMTEGAHREAMPKLANWCDEASVVHWNDASPKLPTWIEAERRMRAEGRPSKVRHPSADHASMTFAAARTALGGSIKPDVG